MGDAREAAVWVVAGCLFEVSLPGDGGRQWRCESTGPEVTLLADGPRHGRHHFRFRAEAAGAAAGVVELRFRGGPAERRVTVGIVPEADLA